MNVEATGTGEAHPFVIPLTKIDVARRLVIGTAAEEIADKSREIMDYASARPQFESWSKEFSDATGGLSKGNLRVMHTKHVAGRLDDIAYDDATKKVQIVAKVVDDNDWQKCLDGVYTGFSIGGGYLRKWKDPDSGLTRYTPVVREISLVDNPCMPTAKFAELVKADGIVDHVALVGKVRTFAEAWAARPAPVATFGERWANRPQTFGELRKKAGPAILDAAFDETKHPREHGRFARAGIRAAASGRILGRAALAQAKRMPLTGKVLFGLGAADLLLRQAVWHSERPSRDHGLGPKAEKLKDVADVVGAANDAATGVAVGALFGPTTAIAGGAILGARSVKRRLNERAERAAARTARAKRAARAEALLDQLPRAKTSSKDIP